MKVSVTRRIVRVVATAVTCAIVIGGGTYVAGGYLERDRNMALARSHAAKLMPMLSSDARYSSIDVMDFYRHDGSLLISGEVETQSDLMALKILVEETRPPVGVRWDVDVRDN